MHNITPRDTPLIPEVIEQYKNIDPYFIDATLVARRAEWSQKNFNRR